MRVTGIQQGYYPQANKNRNLTVDEKETVQEILKKYAAENMSDEDAASLFNDLKEAGIRPSKGLKTLMEDEGFSIKPPEERHLLKMENRPLTENEKETLLDILNNYDAENMSEEDVVSLFGDIKDSGIKPSEEIKSILDDEGFTIEPPQGMRPPQGMNPQMRMNQTLENMPSSITENFLALLQSGEATEEDVSSFIQSVEKTGLFTSGLLIDEEV